MSEKNEIKLFYSWKDKRAIATAATTENSASNRNKGKHKLPDDDEKIVLLTLSSISLRILSYQRMREKHLVIHREVAQHWLVNFGVADSLQNVYKSVHLHRKNFPVSSLLYSNDNVIVRLQDCWRKSCNNMTTPMRITKKLSIVILKFVCN